MAWFSRRPPSLGRTQYLLVKFLKSYMGIILRNSDDKRLVPAIYWRAMIATDTRREGTGKGDRAFQRGFIIGKDAIWLPENPDIYTYIFLHVLLSCSIGERLLLML